MGTLSQTCMNLGCQGSFLTQEKTALTQELYDLQQKYNALRERHGKAMEIDSIHALWCKAGKHPFDPEENFYTISVGDSTGNGNTMVSCEEHTPDLIKLASKPANRKELEDGSNRVAER